jgi:hypothetical protein
MIVITHYQGTRTADWYIADVEIVDGIFTTKTETPLTGNAAKFAQKIIAGANFENWSEFIARGADPRIAGMAFEGTEGQITALKKIQKEEK